MKKLDKFILKAFVGPFFAILLVVIFILMMQFLWLYIDELVGKGLSLTIIGEFLLWGGCTILPLAMPLATLLAAVMTLGQIAENNELMAIKAAGISLTRVLTPLIIASAAISVGAFYASNDLVPFSYNKIYTLRGDILKTKEEIKIPSGTFYDGIDGYVLRVEDTDDKTGIMTDIMVYDHSRGRGNTSLTLADSATMKVSEAKDYLTFTLINGNNYQETNERNFRESKNELNKVRFTHQELIIPLENYAFEKSEEGEYSDQVKTMKLNDLREKRDSLWNVSQKAHQKHKDRVLRTGHLLKSRQMDSTFLAHDHPAFSADSYMTWDLADSRIAACGKAVERISLQIQDLNDCIIEAEQCNTEFRRADLEIYRKYAGAVACFILFFIGAPLGALIRKGGLGTPAIVSVLFFVLYYVVDMVGTKLAKDGAVSASSGAFISSYVLIPIGALLTFMAVRDSSVFNGDSFKSGWKKLKSKVKSMFRKTRIVYMGTPEFAVAPLDALISNGYDVVGVVTVADKPSGRGLKVNESAVKKYAVEHGIPVLQPLKLKDPEFLEQLKAWKADLFIVVAFRMLPEEVWSMPRLGTFNLHAALLPQYRGAAPINWAVINGERITGVTTFMIDKDIDTGGIMLRQDYSIRPDATAGDVHDALMGIGADLVVQTTQGIIEGNIETRVQRSFIQGSEVLNPAPKITRDTCHIDWNKSTKDVYNLIRGLSPYPTAFTQLTREGSNPLQLKIFFGEKVNAEAEPGTILSDGKNYMYIATADGAISVTDLQLEGKKRMDVKSFLLGFREPENYKAV